MAMTVVVTRNVPDRVRGFLASCMCEIGPGVYTAPRMDAAVRDRIWDVSVAWCGMRTEMSVVMTWPDSKLPGGQAVRSLGTPPVKLIEHNGVFLARRELTEDDVRSLTTRFGGRLSSREHDHSTEGARGDDAKSANAGDGASMGDARGDSGAGGNALEDHPDSADTGSGSVTNVEDHSRRAGTPLADSHNSSNSVGERLGDGDARDAATRPEERVDAGADNGNDR